MENKPRLLTRADRMLHNAKEIVRQRELNDQENRRSGRVRTANRRLLDDFITSSSLPKKVRIRFDAV